MKKNWINLFIALLLYIPIGFLQVSIDYTRKLEDLESGLLLMPGQMAGSLVLSGFKGLAADLLWLNIENYWHTGQHYKMLPLLEAVAWLQPHYITVWAVGGWHMSYNIFAQVKGRERELSKMYEEKIKQLSEKEKENLKKVVEIRERLKILINKLSFSIGMEETKIPKLLEEITYYENILNNFKGSERENEIVKLVNSLVPVVREMIYWYTQGVKFLKKGIAYNPEKYDLYFELGWTYYHKGRDYPNSVRYLEKAIKFPHPDYVDNVLAHAYEKNGEIDLAIKQWEKLLNTGFKTIAERAIKTLKKGEKFTP